MEVGITLFFAGLIVVAVSYGCKKIYDATETPDHEKELLRLDNLRLKQELAKTYKQLSNLQDNYTNNIQNLKAFYKGEA